MLILVLILFLASLYEVVSQVISSIAENSGNPGYFSIIISENWVMNSWAASFDFISIWKVPAFLCINSISSSSGGSTSLLLAFCSELLSFAVERVLNEMLLNLKEAIKLSKISLDKRSISSEPPIISFIFPVERMKFWIPPISKTTYE